jgi:hypothetical protein
VHHPAGAQQLPDDLAEMKLRAIRSWLCGLGCGLFLIAGSPGEEATPPAFALHTGTGKDVVGCLKELKKDWSIAVGDSAAAGGEVVSLRRVGVSLPPFPTGEHLVLANGDRIPVRSVRLVGERLQFVQADPLHPGVAGYLDGGKESSVSQAAVSLLWRTAPDRAEDAERLRRQLAAESRTADVVLLRNGDRVSGVLHGLEADKVSVEVGKKVVEVRLAQVAAVALSTELVEVPRPKGPYAVLTLADGARLALSSATCADGNTLEGDTAFGARLKVPLSFVVTLDVLGGPAVYLSELKPSRYVFTPYLDERWEVAADANVAGHDLVLAGATYARGLGLHSQSRVSYDLAGKYRRFEALVGLDDHDGRDGSVRIRLLADGKPLELRPDRELTAAGPPLAIGVSVEGVRELTLVVEFGRNGNVGDVVNWADARLLR